MEFTKTNRGQQKLCLDGFMYTKQVVSKNRIRWKCVERGNHCKGCLTTSHDMDDVLMGEGHNNDPNPMKTEVAKARTTLKEVSSKQQF